MCTVRTGLTRIVRDARGVMVVQRQVLQQGTFGSTEPRDRLIWIRAYTVAQALSPTFSRISNR
jgi:hypothetical protein